MSISKKGIARMLCCMFLYIVIWTCFDVYFGSRIQDKVQAIDAGWTLCINGDVYDNMVLSKFRIEDLHENDIVEITRSMEAKQYAQSVLRVNTRYSAIKVYLDQELLYEDMHEEQAAGKVLGTGYHFIQLPDDYGDRELHIVFSVGEHEAFTAIDPIIIMDSMVLFEETIDANLMPFFVAVLAVGIAFISVFLSLGTGLHEVRYRMILWLGMFSLSVGVWIASTNYLIQIFCSSLTVKCYVEYISMFAAFTSLLIYVSEFLTDQKGKKLFRGLFSGMIALCTVLVILNVTNIIHFPKTGTIFHLYALICTVTIIVKLLHKSVRHKKAERVFRIGIISIAFNSIAEILRYRYNKMCLTEYRMEISFVPIGVVLFLVFLFISYYYRIVERVAEEMERKTLYDMAYQDNLTRLKNRAWCEKVMREYETAKKPVSIINMDLNDFKQVNDTMGHTAGDDLLISFAECLANEFRENDCVGRMGGDEFIVIIDYVSDQVIEDHMVKLQERINQINADRDFTISFSYGYVSDVTGEVSPYKLYESADHKMYAYKRKIKKNHI